MSIFTDRDIELIKNLARTANQQGKQETVAFLLNYLENLIPVGGKYDTFQAFCTELEEIYYPRR